LRQLDAYPNATVFGKTRKYTARDLAIELRAVLAEREWLAAQWDAHQNAKNDATQPRDAFGIQGASHQRRLRSYKGVTYREGKWCHPSHMSQANVYLALSANFNNPTDADHAALLALRDDPFEPVETLEAIIEPALTAMYELGWDRQGGSSDMAAEDLAESIRTWLAQQPPCKSDGQTYWAAVAMLGRLSPETEALTDTLGVLTQISDVLSAQPAPALTAAQHVAALVGMGAKQYSNIADDEMRFVGRRDLVLLPREATP
jgi:hypothetical protein